MECNMDDITSFLERSKKPYLAKIASLEQKKTLYIDKIDSEIAKIATKLEAIDNAIEVIKGSLPPAEEVPAEDIQQVVTMEDTIDPFRI